MPRKRCQPDEPRSARSDARCGSMIVGDRMPAMAVFRSANRDSCRDIARRLMVVGAVFCLLTMSAHAQTAGAAPTPADPGAPAPADNAGTSAADQSPAPGAPTEAEPPSATAAPTLETNDPKQVVESQQQLVTRTEQQFGKRSRQAAEAYFDLAEAQRRAGDHVAAEKSYLAAIALYHSLDGMFTPLAIEPLTALGDNYRENNDYVSAMTAYNEARTINRHEYGLLNEDQIPRAHDAFALELNQRLVVDAVQPELLGFKSLLANFDIEALAIFNFDRHLAGSQIGTVFKNMRILGFDAERDLADNRRHRDLSLGGGIDRWR